MYSSQWVGKDALRDLSKPKVRLKLAGETKKRR